MKDVFWLIPERLAGRAGPSREPWSLSELHAAGFRVVINLSEIEPDRDEFAAAQIDVVWIPLPTTYPSDEETEKACLAALPQACATLQSHLDANRPVLVHCAWGRDRTGLLLASHLALSEGVSPREAIARVRLVRPKAISAGWEEMSERVIAELQRTGISHGLQGGINGDAETQPAASRE